MQRHTITNRFAKLLYISFMFLLVSAVLFSNATTYALSPEQKRLYSSGVYAFDIETGENACSSGGSVSIDLTGDSNAAKALNFFIGKGLTDYQAAGIVANLKGESSVIPTRKQGSGMQTIKSIDEVVAGQGFGIAQWTSGGRQENWKKFAIEKNMDPLSLELQLLYLWHELETVPNYGYEQIVAAKDLRQATWIFLVFFERPAATSGYEQNPTPATSGSAKEALDTRVGLAPVSGGSGGDAAAAPVLTTEEASNCGAKSEGGGAGFRIATFNIGNVEAAADWEGRMVKSVDLIKNKKLDVVGLQEVWDVQHERITKQDRLGDEYELFPKTPAGAGYASTNSIAFRKDMFELDQAGSKILPGYTSGGPSDKAATQVKLRSKESGQEFYVINSHEPVGNEAKPIKQRYESALQKAKYIEELRKTDSTPIFLTGDFNAGYNHRDKQPTYQNKIQNLSYCILTADNLKLWDAKDAAENKTGQCPSSKGSSGIVDHIYMDTTTTARGYTTIDYPGNGSDAHPTVFVDVKIPGSDTSGGGVYSADGFTFPLKISKAGIVNNKESVWCYKSTKNCHHDYNAADIFAPTGTTVIATRGGRVESAKDNATNPSRIGSRVAIMGDDGNLYYYAHMGSNTLVVKNGQKISAGDPIGKVGTKENTAGTDPHLHIDRLPGKQYPYRPECSGGACSGYPFFNIQSIMSEVFKAVK